MSNVASGILERTKKGTSVLRVSARSSDDVGVPAQLVQEYHLVEGATVAGPVQRAKRGLELVAVESVCGLAPETFRERTPYTRLVAIDPCELSLIHI